MQSSLLTAPDYLHGSARSKFHWKVSLHQLLNDAVLLLESTDRQSQIVNPKSNVTLSEVEVRNPKSLYLCTCLPPTKKSSTMVLLTRTCFSYPRILKCFRER